MSDDEIATKDPEFDADAFILSGVTENRTEDGEYYENRNFVLSFEEDDAGDIDMRISDADPLFNLDKILWAIDRADSLEEVRKFFPDNSDLHGGEASQWSR